MESLPYQAPAPCKPNMVPPRYLVCGNANYRTEFLQPLTPLMQASRAIDCGIALQSMDPIACRWGAPVQA